MIRYSALVLALAFFVVTEAVEAQMNPTQATCSSLASAAPGMRLPAPTDTSVGGLAWDLLRGCGATGSAAVAAALQSAAIYTESDSARVVEFFTTFRGHRSADLFAALTAVVKNSSASGPVRSEAISALGALYRPHVYFHKSNYLMTNPAPSSCARGYEMGDDSGDQSSLPVDILNQALTAMRLAEADGAASQSVRGAARCWRISLEQDVPPIGSKILLTYICGNRFRVRNTNTAPAKVSTDVYGTTEKHAMIVYPGYDYFFGNLKKGTVRLFFKGQLVQTKANGGTTCP
jgi:hypothetical protein